MIISIAFFLFTFFYLSKLFFVKAKRKMGKNEMRKKVEALNQR